MKSINFDGIEIREKEVIQVEAKKEKYNPIDVAYSAINKKKQEPSRDEIEQLPEYLFLNLLSNNKDIIDMINIFNILPIPVYWQYRIVRDLLPSMYIKYPKKTKEDEELQTIADYYGVSLQVAKQYKEFLSSDSIKLMEKKG